MEIIIEKTENNYSAYSPEIDGCIATGDTEEQAKQNFQEALELHLKGIEDDTKNNQNNL